MKHPLFIRAANIAKFGGSAAKVVITKHGGELYVIKHWLMSDVISGLVNKNPGIGWGFLLMRTKRPKRANRRFVNHLDWR
ncbi:TPA: hypothetical protein NU934_001711 [Vibrio cholerae]|nr:hypothetical protein [Vibrio cholerae]